MPVKACALRPRRRRWRSPRRASAPRWSSRPTARGSAPSSSTTAPPGQYGWGADARCSEHRLPRPSSPVLRIRGRPAGPRHCARVVARQRARAVDVPEEDPVGVDAQAVHDARERRDARAAHLHAEQPRGERRQAVRHARRAGGHRRGADDLGRVVQRRGQRPREHARERLQAGERRAAGRPRSRRGARRRAAAGPAGRAPPRRRTRASGGGRGSGRGSPRRRRRARRRGSGPPRAPARATR